MRRSSLFLTTLGSALLGACASNSGVVPIGPDTFMISRQAATGFTGSGNLKADALREAKQYCASLKKVMQVVNTTEAKPPYVFGNFPKAEVQFMCLSAGDSELARPKMRKEPDVVIESTATSTISGPAAAGVTMQVPVPIESDPSGADVYLDGTFVGNTPLPQFSIAPGEHVLELKKLGLTTWKRNIRVIQGAPAHVHAILEAPPPKH